MPGDNEDEALVFTMKLMDLTVHMSVPNTSPAALEQSRVRARGAGCWLGRAGGAAAVQA